MTVLTGIPKRHLATPTSLKSRAKIPLLYVGDIFIFYIALTLTLLIRYGAIRFQGPDFEAHAGPFTYALFGWLLIFYIGGLYEKQSFNQDVLTRRFFPLVGIGSLFLILLFYFVPSFGITPKINLFVFIILFSAIGYLWRITFIALLKQRAGSKANRVMLVGENAAGAELEKYIKKHPHHGYETVIWLKEGLKGQDTPEQFANFVIVKGINTIVVPAKLEHDPGALRMLYYAFMSGIEVVSLADFYERVFDKVSIEELEDSWLIKNLPRVAKRYRIFKYIFESLLALLVLVTTLPFTLLAVLAIKISSPGTIFYSQKRVGQNEEPFVLYKFRTMYSTKDKNPDADASVPTWSAGNDARITPIGKFLRASHIDELPQLINVLRGEMSFVGPRPERPEFTAELEKKIPYYELRYLLRPGITGWAQINYRYGASIEDAYQKLQYEIYYLKNRSLLLDAAIIVKTIKKFFVQET
jgi:exopolysaccharide biosynthesis polyprenyl glycosylphosphotransferase